MSIHSLIKSIVGLNPDSFQLRAWIRRHVVILQPFKHQRTIIFSLLLQINIHWFILVEVVLDSNFIIILNFLIFHIVCLLDRPDIESCPYAKEVALYSVPWLLTLVLLLSLSMILVHLCSVTHQLLHSKGFFSLIIRRFVLLYRRLHVIRVFL